MEIIDYLRIARRRLWVLLVVPVLAGGAVAALVLTGPTSYQARAFVAAPALVGGDSSNQYSGPQGVTTFVNAFIGRATSYPLAMQVQSETGVPAADVMDGTTITQADGSSQLQVLFQTTHEDVADRVAAAVARDTMQFLFASQVKLAQASLDSASKAQRDAEAAITSWVTAHGNVLPQEQYAALQQQVLSMEQQQIINAKNGNATVAAALSAAISAHQRDIARLVALMPDYATLDAARDVARTRVADASASLDAARRQYAAAEPTAVVSVVGPQENDRVSELVQKVLPAVGAGLLLAVGLVVLLEIGDRRRYSPHEVLSQADEQALTTPRS